MRLSLFLKENFWHQNGAIAKINAKIVLETKKHYLHKTNKTPWKIHKYINKTCLKQNQTKLKKKSYLSLYITQTARKTQQLEKTSLLFRA